MDLRTSQLIKPPSAVEQLSFVQLEDKAEL